MKVCIIGDFTQNQDEGLKNIAYYTSKGLSNIKRHQFLNVNVVNILSLSAFAAIWRYHPDIIHYIPGPSNKSLAFLRFLKAYLGNKPKIMLSASYPIFSDALVRWMGFKPDFALAQSMDLKKRFDTLGIASQLIPNGVDLDKFKPDSSRKGELRDKYGLDRDSFTVLHVGHLMAKRNLDLLTRVSRDFQVVIVASKYIKTEPQLVEKLKKAGCLIFSGYFPDVEEFYQLSDCYVFPVVPGDSVVCPLSVMEAMACNLPVVTTKFEGISSFFVEGDGLIFANDDRDILCAITGIRDGSMSIATRAKVERYSWRNIAEKIADIYDQLLTDEFGA